MEERPPRIRFLQRLNDTHRELIPSVLRELKEAGAITFAPGVGASSSFTYQINDGTADSAVITVTTYVTAKGDPRPHPISSPQRSVAEGDVFSYAFRADVSQVGSGADLNFVLVGTVPSGMTLTKTGNATAVINWNALGTDNTHMEFGILCIDPAAKRAGYQPVYFLLLPLGTAPPLGSG